MYHSLYLVHIVKPQVYVLANLTQKNVYVKQLVLVGMYVYDKKNYKTYVAFFMPS